MVELIDKTDISGCCWQCWTA